MSDNMKEIKNLNNKLKNVKKLHRDELLEIEIELKTQLEKIKAELLMRKTWRDEILEKTTPIGGLFAHEFNSCPEEEPINHKLELQKEMSRDVKDGLLDLKTAEKVNEFAKNAQIYSFERNKLIVHKPEVLNIDVNAKQWFKNFLYQNYVSSTVDIKLEDMLITYTKNTFSDLVWINEYGVRFKMDIKKYVHFLDNYVF